MICKIRGKFSRFTVPLGISSNKYNPYLRVNRNWTKAIEKNDMRLVLGICFMTAEFVMKTFIQSVKNVLWWYKILWSIHGSTFSLPQFRYTIPSTLPALRESSIRKLLWSPWRCGLLEKCLRQLCLSIYRYSYNIPL